MKVFRKKLFLFIFIPLFFTGISEDLISGDLGPADFPSEAINSGPKSSHTAWCKQLGRNCVIVFDNEKMIVDNFKGIKREQFIDFRTSWDRNEMYYYVNYLNSENKKIRPQFKPWPCLARSISRTSVSFFHLFFFFFELLYQAFYKPTTQANW